MTNESSVTPYICVHDAAAAIEFYKKAFGAVEVMRIPAPEGRIGHAEFKVGEALIMISDEHPELGVVSPRTLNGTTCTLHLAVPAVDDVLARATESGAKLERPAKDEFYGMRTGTILDPFGHRWHIGSYIEQLTAEEIEKRAAALYGANA
jgi:PhnB protein